jgi:hypothetical protein
MMFAIFLRIGEWMNYVSGERESANNGLQSDAAKAPRA